MFQSPFLHQVGRPCQIFDFVDQNKLGQKMLEKMGWSAGKGLGAKEQGRVDALRISHKVDVRGLGASRKKEQEYWLQQQESFQSLLQSLNGGNDQNVEVKSLEERSKTSKARVHYHKFTRGKDISRYSKKDLSCIVGGGVAAPKVIPASVVSKSQEQPGDKLESEDFDEEMELRSKRSSRVSDPVVEKPTVPAKKKKSKNKNDNPSCNAGLEDTEPSDDVQDLPGPKRRKSNRKRTSDQVVDDDLKGPKRKPKKTDNVENMDVEQVTAVDEGSSQTKTRKSNRKLISGPKIAGIVAGSDEKLNSKRKLSSKKTNDKDEKISVDHIAPIEVDENVQNSSIRETRKTERSKKYVPEESDDCCSVVPVKQGKKKNNALVMDGVEDKDERKKNKKKKEKPSVETVEDSPVEKQPPLKKKTKRKNPVEEDEGVQTCLKEESGTGKDKKKKKKWKDDNSAKEVDPEELDVSASQETVVSSQTLLENEDAETELGSLNSQSSLINELLGIKKRNSIDFTSRPECWYKNHILSQESEESSDEERMTGIPKTKTSS
uniref:PIN2/TERF1-interacting telomerase inhibitor 1 n=1 Tax=Lygus hesperus TaxID=30085 RepID=A0A146L9U8_LYGHE